MRFLDFWTKLEEIVIVISLSAMVLISGTYVLLNNMYDPFFWLADIFPDVELFSGMALFIIDLAQKMSWSVAMTKFLFSILIFIGTSYAVKVGGHIGVDAVVKLLPRRFARWVSAIAAIACLIYAVLIFVASYEWVKTIYSVNAEAEDLWMFGMKQWHLSVVIPVAYCLIFVRFFEITYRVITGRQETLGLADEKGEAIRKR